MPESGGGPRSALGADDACRASDVRAFRHRADHAIGAALAHPQLPRPRPAAAATTTVTTYCATCHSERGKAGGLSLAAFDAVKFGDDVVELHGNACGFLFGVPAQNELVEISVDGERKALLDIDPKLYEGSTSLIMKTPGVQVSAGAHRVTAAFMPRFEGPVNDLIAPIDHTLADTQVDVAFGITTLPHLKDLALAGPQHAVKYPIEERGTSPNARDADGHTAQHHAASRGDDEMIKYLVSKGADVTMLNRGGQTTVDMANGPVLRVQPFPETIKLLESLARRTTASAFPVGRQAR